MSSLKYDHILAFILDHPWALTPSLRTVVAEILARRPRWGGALPE